MQVFWEEKWIWVFLNCGLVNIVYAVDKTEMMRKIHNTLKSIDGFKLLAIISLLISVLSTASLGKNVLAQTIQENVWSESPGRFTLHSLGSWKWDGILSISC